MVALTLHCDSRTVRLTFTGDLGRRNALVVRPPAPIPEADVLVCESTYGGRSVGPPTEATAALHAIVGQTVDRGGKVIVPAFSLGRTQVVVDALVQGILAEQVPLVPIFVDGGLAAELVEVHRRHAASLNPDAASRLRDGGVDGGGLVHYLRSPEASREAGQHRDPCVLIAPSGMCEGGRILRHLKDNLDDPRASVVLVNYQAPHTLGRRLLERGPTVRFHGKKWNKWAEITALPGFSGHADHDDLLAALTPLVGRAGRIRLVHGEPEQAEALTAALTAIGFSDVASPERGERLEL